MLTVADRKPQDTSSSDLADGAGFLQQPTPDTRRAPGEEQVTVPHRSGVTFHTTSSVRSTKDRGGGNRGTTSPRSSADRLENNNDTHSSIAQHPKHVYRHLRDVVVLCAVGPSARPRAK